MDVESSATCSPSPPLSVATGATTSDEDEHQAKSFLEDTPYLQTHSQIMTVDIDISESKGKDTDNDTSFANRDKGNNGVMIPTSKSGHNSVNISSNGGGGGSLPINYNSHQPLLNQVLNGNLKNSSELKRIQRTAVSEERLTAAWRKLI